MLSSSHDHRYNTMSEAISGSNRQMSNSARHRPIQMKTRPKDDVFLNLAAGAIAGSAGVMITCPLDLVQTRLQSSPLVTNSQMIHTMANSNGGQVLQMSKPKFGLQLLSYIRQVVEAEGKRGLCKGLVPNLVGIVPSRASYFAVYHKSKTILGSHLSKTNASITHLLAALTASWTVSTLTNPLWFIKTRLQLDQTTSGQRKSILRIVGEVYKNEGIRGFYRGLSASYIGASETMIFFVLYEKIKSALLEEHAADTRTSQAADLMVASFAAKMVATVSVYPHEVARTRLRQQQKGGVYHGFVQTLRKVHAEEGWRGLYGGMGAHLTRQVPNTVVMFLVFETIINTFSGDAYS